MNELFDQQLEKIRKLERELEKELAERSRQLRDDFQKKKVRFEKSIRKQQKKFKINLFRYVFTARIRHVLIAPIIYAMVIPIAFIDITVFIYQHICFRVYRVPIVRRKDYFYIDRHHLSYLNTLEKFNCVYCGYGNGVAAYVKEIIARTEQYWCPIKHASHVKDPHSRYYKFFEYGDAENYRKKLQTVKRDYRR